MLDDYAVSDSGSTGGSGNQNRSRNMLILLQATQKEYKERYGGSSEQYKAIGTASLLAADLSEGYAKHATMSLHLNAMNSRIAETNSRADAMLASISRGAEKVAGEQKAHFLKAGVKLEGSAMNVIADTMVQAGEMERQKQHEISYAKTQMNIQKAMLETKMAGAPIETLLSMGGSYATASTM